MKESKWKCNICNSEGRKYLKNYLAIKSLRTHAHRFEEKYVDGILYDKNGKKKRYFSTFAGEPCQ